MRLDNLFEDDTTPAITNQYEYRQLTDTQEKILALLPIPSAILSILGSVAVITMVARLKKSKSWNTYHGLLTAISCCAMISSITLVLGPFLYPKNTSNHVWAIGNDASCTGVAFMNQFATSALLYHAMLGIFFILKAKFGFYNDEIKVKYENMMHMVAIGYPLLTAFGGLFLDAYGERPGTHGCWIQTCPFTSSLEEREDCINPRLDWFFRDMIVVFVLVCVIFSSVYILLDLRRKIEQVETKQRQRAKKRALQLANENRENDVDHSDDWSTSSRRTTVDDLKAEQSRLKAKHRLQLKIVRAQADIYIGGFIICNFASFAFRYLVGDSAKLSYVEEMEIPYKYYPWLVMQAVLLPLNGFFNFLIFVRPHYMKNRVKYSDEPRTWAIRRAIFGNSFLGDADIDDKSINSKTTVTSAMNSAGMMTVSKLDQLDKPPTPMAMMQEISVCDRDTSDSGQISELQSPMQSTTSKKSIGSSSSSRRPRAGAFPTVEENTEHSYDPSDFTCTSLRTQDLEGHEGDPTKVTLSAQQIIEQAAASRRASSRSSRQRNVHFKTVDENSEYSDGPSEFGSSEAGSDSHRFGLSSTSLFKS